MKTRLCLALMVAIFFASCHSSFQIEKRRYRAGWHVHFSDNKIKSPTTDDKRCIQENESLESVPLVAELPQLPENKESIPVQDNLPKWQDIEPNNPVVAKVTTHDLEKIKPVKRLYDQASLVSANDQPAPSGSTSAKWWMALAYATACGLMLAGIAKYTHKNQRKASRWASQNKRLSRLVLGASQIVVLTGFLNIGHELAHLGIGTGKLWTPAWLCAGAALALGYPMKSSALNYARRKKMDLGLIFCLSMLSFDLGNRHKADPDSLCSTSNNVIGMLTPESSLSMKLF
ncbi:MAG: hypothetical protein JNM00_07305, partial [Flavobacteriales bacterium]|nr:hypothetical protein [Flavobacteriales bacterium]